ncbi:MAG: hypothetical protein AB8B63_22960 [Granulosicoccus sp.]
MLLGSLTGTATVAVLLTPLPSPLQIAFVLFTLTLGLSQIKMLYIVWRLAHFQQIDNANQDLPGGGEPREYWSISSDTAKTVTGRLITAGYRSANLLVLVLQTDSGQWHRIPVWTDSLSASHFSYLNCQMAYNSSAPESRANEFLIAWCIAFRTCLNYTRQMLRKLGPKNYR